MKNLDKIFSFLDFLRELQKIERKQYVVGEKRMENDVEHSYQLVMLCWFLINYLDLDLDSNKVLKYALAHDLVEVYTGDTPFWDADKEGDNEKDQRERKAIKKIEDQFKNSFPELIETIKEYEKSKTVSREGSFVYALDKLIPILNNYQGSRLDNNCASLEIC